MGTCVLVGIIVIVSFVAVRQIVLFIMLCKCRYKANDYNRFIYMAYTQHEKPTPAIVGRIQYSYIEVYNNRRKRYRFLSLFFRPMPLLGEPSQREYELFDTIQGSDS